MDPLGGVRSSVAKGRGVSKGVKNRMKMAKAAKAKSAKFGMPEIGYLLIFLLFGALLGLTVMIPYYGWVNFSIARVGFLTISGLSILLGIWHNRRMYAKIPWAHPLRFWPEFWLTLGTAVMLGLGLFLVYFFLPKLHQPWEGGRAFSLRMAFACLSFVIPFILVHCFERAFAIPPKKYPLWYYPKDYIEQQPTWDHERVVYANMVFRPKWAEDRKKRIEVRLPLEANFGEVIYLFINDYNENKSPDKPLESLREVDNSLGWLFSVPTKIWKFRVGKRYLDPELTIEENNISKQINIEFQRIKREVDNE